MGFNQAATGSVDFMDSLSIVTLNVESERFKATYDSTRDSPSLAVVAIVATALGKDPQALTPLYSIIDTDALDELATESANGRAGCNRVTFCSEGLEVTVSTEEVIVAASPENT